MGIPFLLHHTTTTTLIIMENLSQQSLSSNPLFSSIVTLYILILLYFPQLFFNLIISFLFISTLILLLTLLRLGASQQQQSSIILGKSEYSPLQCQNQNINSSVKPILVENDELQGVEKEVAKPECNSLVVEPHTTLTKPDPKPKSETKPEPCDPCELIENDIFVKLDQENKLEPLQTMQKSQCLSWAELEPVYSPSLFLQWEVSAPLEVIYEAFEDAEEGGESQNDVFCGKKESCKKEGTMTCKYPSLSRYYPESDSDSDSDSDLDSVCSSYEEEEREGLIEIALDYDGDYYYDKGIINMIIKPNDKVVDYEELHLDDEDNLIEIDISPTKNMSHFSW